MESFKYMYSISFNDKFFVVLYNPKYNQYILEVNENGSITYPQFEDFEYFYNCQHTPLPAVLKNSFLDNLKIKSQNINNNILLAIKRFKEQAKNGIELVPKLLRNGTLILLSAGLVFMSGCAIKNTPTGNIPEKPTVVEPKAEEQVGPQIEIQEQEPAEEQMDIWTPSIKFQQFGDTQIPYLHGYHSEESQKDVVYCENIKEFKSYLNLGFDPTYSDVAQAFKENNDIPEEIKSRIISLLGNMGKEFPDLDLSTLYYNANRMKFVYSSSITDETLPNVDTTALFRAVTGEVVFNENEEIPDIVLAHEVLGHGSTEAYYIKDDNVVYSGFNICLYEPSDEGYLVDAKGRMLSEGVANIIGKKISNQEANPMYAMGEETFRIISELNGQTLTETINSRGWDLLINMHELGNINNPVEYIVYLDNLFTSWADGQLIEGETRLSDFFRILVYDSMEERVASGDKTCIDQVHEILTTNTFFPDGIEIDYFLDEDKTQKSVVESYHSEDVATSIEEKLEGETEDIPR